MVKTAQFTHYAGNTFGWQEQLSLAEQLLALAQKGTKIAISNHDLPKARQLYQASTKIYGFKVLRSISAQALGRKYVKELLAVYE